MNPVASMHKQGALFAALATLMAVAMPTGCTTGEAPAEVLPASACQAGTQVTCGCGNGTERVRGTYWTTPMGWGVRLCSAGPHDRSPD